MMITLKIDDLRGEIAPLYCRYPGQTNPQPAYVEMDEAGYVFANYSGEIGNGEPAYVRYGRALRWGVPSDIDGDVLADLLERDDVIALLERIHAGHSAEWDGNNHVGHLDNDAQEANDELASILYEELVHRDDYSGGVWNAGEWIEASGLLGNWGDEPLAEAISRIETQAQSERVQLDGDLKSELLDWAVWYIENYRAGLGAHHLRELLKADLIPTEWVTEYAKAHDIRLDK